MVEGRLAGFIQHEHRRRILRHADQRSLRRHLPIDGAHDDGYRPAARVGGICALICAAEVIISGSGWLFSVTHTPPSVVGSGFAADESFCARRLPKIETKAPGARLAVKLARVHDAVVLQLGSGRRIHRRQRHDGDAGSGQRIGRSARGIDSQRASADGCPAVAGNRGKLPFERRGSEQRIARGDVHHLDTAGIGGGRRIADQHGLREAREGVAFPPRTRPRSGAITVVVPRVGSVGPPGTCPGSGGWLGNVGVVGVVGVPGRVVPGPVGVGVVVVSRRG